MCANGAQAQSDGGGAFAADTSRQINRVDVTASRKASNVTASKPVQMMTKEEINLLGIHELADAVKKFAGADVRDYGGIGGMKTVSVRNLGAHHTAVSYDGVTLSNTQAGQIDIGRFSLDNVESISFALGNDDNLMQTARHYAAAGILSVNTEKPHFKEGTNDALKGNLRIASFGMVSPNLRYWHRFSDRTALSADASYMRADGNYPFTLVNGKNVTNEKRYNSDIYSWKGEMDIHHTFNDDSKLSAKAYYYYSERGLPGSVVLYNRIAEERLWDEDFFTQARYDRNMGREWKLSAKLKYTHSWNRYQDTNVKYEGGKQTDVNRQNEYYGAFTIGWLPTADFSMALAQDIFFNDLRSNVSISDYGHPSNPDRFTSLTALAAKWKKHGFQIDGSAVATYAHERVEAGKQPSDKFRLTPSLAASVALPGYEALRLRAMFKSTFRMPSFNDLYYIRMGNTGLRPEKANEYNVGVTWSGRPFGFTKYLNITVDGYYNNVTDKIVAFPSTYVWKMANFGKVHIHGIDATLATEIGVGRNVDLVLNGTYSFQKAEDRLKKSATYGKQLPYTPRHCGNASLLVKNPWVNVGYSLIMQGKRWSSPMNKSIYALDPFWEHTVTLSHLFQFKGWNMEVIATLRNITDEQYEIIQYYPMPGRSGEINLRFHF